jgi:hypothetical protein
MKTLNNLKYSAHEFFYDGSFIDYPLTNIFDLSTSYMINYQRENFRLNGEDLLHNSKYFLKCYEFSNLKEDSFINAFQIEQLNGIDTLNPRIITYSRFDDNGYGPIEKSNVIVLKKLPLYPLLKIALIEVSGVKVEYTYKANLITIVAYSSELFYE